MRFGSDPFAKVTGLISDMIARLEAEAEADATEKAYCDKELSETNAKKDDKDAEIAKLTTQIDQKNGQVSTIKGGSCRTPKEPCRHRQSPGRDGQAAPRGKRRIRLQQGGLGARR